MPIETIPLFTRDILRSRPADLFVFGDNMTGTGLGGQAKACRDEPNAVGIPTKWAPALDDTAFFRDSDFPIVRDALNRQLLILVDHIKSGGTIILPSAGIGTGLAKLPVRAPRIHKYLTRAFARLHEIDGNHSRERDPIGLS